VCPAPEANQRMPAANGHPGYHGFAGRLDVGLGSCSRKLRVGERGQDPATPKATGRVRLASGASHDWREPRVDGFSVERLPVPQ
jgi:hypothetical protein